MDPFVDQLKRICSTYPIRSKWVFVPTHAIGRTLGERIALEGTNWLNLRFVTPLDVALPMAAPFLIERGIDPSEEGLGPALMMRLLLDLPSGRATSGHSLIIPQWRRRSGRPCASCAWLEFVLSLRPKCSHRRPSTQSSSHCC